LKLKHVRIILFIILAMMTADHNLYASEPPSYDLKVRIYPEKHLLEGKATITVPAGMKPYIQAGGLDIRRLTINDTEYSPGKDSIKELEVGEGEKTIEIEYSAVFGPSEEKEDIENSGVAGGNLINDSGVVLLSNWYPSLGGPAFYNLAVELPADLEVISEADSETVRIDGDIKTVTFELPHPVPDITLVAGKYVVDEEVFHGIAIRTFFFPSEKELSATYLEEVKRYIELYESMIGKFPYRSFSVVENIFQTGYSFPAYTLLGSGVIRLPFIVKTSLGHEILHQWFGNHVYVDYEHGNWSEGLTTYLADHWYKHLAGEGASYRKKILIDYMNYVQPEKEKSLREFTGREDFATRTIGYGKAAMVFHMLRKKVGDEAFFTALKQFIESNRYRSAGWDDIKKAFGASLESEVDRFFEQWIEGRGIPEITIRSAHVVFRDGKYLLSLDITQRGDVYALDLPVRVEIPGGWEEFIVHMDKKEVHVERAFDKRPGRLVLDPEYDVMRKLTDAEKPPVISAFTGSKKNIVILPEEGKGLYQEAADFFSSQGYAVKEAKDVTNDDLKKASVLMLSAQNRIYRRLFADRPLPEAGVVVQVAKNPLNPSGVAIVLDGRDRDEIKTACRKLFRYGNYSFLAFDSGRNTARETAPSESGITRTFATQPDAVETADIMGLEDVIGKIGDRRVIFVGEIHTEYSHHVMQYEIIRRLYELNGSIVIAMEMFQEPFQEWLDRYIAGETDEAEFLKKTEYFDRWQFDYNLYRDILQFARANRIPVIALNLKKEIIEKVSKEGIDALTDEEYALIPQDIDMTDRDYRESMKEVFNSHAMRGRKDFDNFFQAQILWDETMAHNVAKALEKYPDSQVVVLAGNGHLEYSWGIPGRVRRLSHASTAVILNDSGEGLSKELADFVLYPPEMETPSSPKLMVMLSEEEGRVKVDRVMKGGPAARAGIEEGDVITAMDDVEIRDVADIKIFLLSKKKGDTVKVSIERPRFLIGPKKITLDVEL